MTTTVKDNRRKKKKKGNSPTSSGRFMGLHAAKRQLEEVEMRDMEAQAERELEEEKRSRRLDEERLNNSDEQRDPDRMPAETLFRRVEEDVKAIKRVAATSNNLKGTYIRALKEASTSILEAAENMATRTSSREVRLLQRENDRLRAELQLIRSELNEIRRMMDNERRGRETRYSSIPDPMPLPRAEADQTQTSGKTGEIGTNLAESVAACVLKQVGQMMESRFAAIEGRLAPERTFRPSLGSKGEREGRTAGRSLPAPADTEGKRKRRDKTPAQSGDRCLKQSTLATIGPSVPKSSSSSGNTCFPSKPTEAGEWATVVRRERGRNTLDGGQAVEQARRETRPPVPTGAEGTRKARQEDHLRDTMQ